MKKFTVAVTKKDGIESTYFVAAFSLGEAEATALKEVFNAKYALASNGWPINVKFPDIYSRGVADDAVMAMFN